LEQNATGAFSARAPEAGESGEAQRALYRFLLHRATVKSFPNERLLLV
jgi:hypothetical protein